MKILIACECSGVVRESFRNRGHDAWSCDLKPTEIPGQHFRKDIREILDWRRPQCWDLLIAHPDCTYLTSSAEWAYKDADYDRYPGVGYHMKLKPGTLTGAARRTARVQAVKFVLFLRDIGIPKIAIENPIGHLSAAWRPADQIIQPYQFGDDASKATSLWLKNLPRLTPTKHVAPRLVTDAAGKVWKRWGNQTDGGQNKLSPSDTRGANRARTYQGIADAMADQWGNQGNQETDDVKGSEIGQGLFL